MAWTEMEKKKTVVGEKEAAMKSCPECGSFSVRKLGFGITREGKKQRLQCKNCGRTFYEVKEEEVKA